VRAHFAATGEGWRRVFRRPFVEITPMNTQVLDGRRDISGGYRVDVSRASASARVSRWFSRPADHVSVAQRTGPHSRDRTNRSRTRVVDSALIRWKQAEPKPERLVLMLPGFRQESRRPIGASVSLQSQIGAPALTAATPCGARSINLQYA